jgi:hypothetical protein
VNYFTFPRTLSTAKASLKGTELIKWLINTCLPKIDPGIAQKIAGNLLESRFNPPFKYFIPAEQNQQ